jgi:predicted DNA-binding protein YlxM (UPF0122 family)
MKNYYKHLGRIRKKSGKEKINNQTGKEKTMKVILRKKSGKEKINNQTGKEKTMTQEESILNIYAKKMNIFKNLGNGQGVEKKKNLMQDILNESCIKILGMSNIDNVEHLFNRIIKNTTIDKLRSFNTESQIIEFESSFESIVIDIMQYNEEYMEYKELLTHVYKRLNRLEKTLFSWYHVKTFSMQYIADKLHTNKMNVCRMIKKLNKKLYKMRLKDLFFVPFVAPCLTQDKKMPSYGMSKPEDRDHVKVINASKETMYIYRSESIDVKQQYEHFFTCYLALSNTLHCLLPCFACYLVLPARQSDKNDFKYVNDRMSIKQGVYLTPIKNKAIYDSYEIIPIDNGNSIDYHTYYYTFDYQGNKSHGNGCMREFNKLGKRY